MTKMASHNNAYLFFFLLLLSLSSDFGGRTYVGVVNAADDAKPTCTDYAKGDFGPKTIADNDTCREACETAEGLPVGDYNDDGHKCSCKSEPDSSGNVKETRTICEDAKQDDDGSGGATTAAAPTTVLAATAIAAATAATAML